MGDLPNYKRDILSPNGNIIRVIASHRNLTAEEEQAIVNQIADEIEHMEPGAAIIHTDDVSIQRIDPDYAWVLMLHNYTYGDGWWHPVGVYTNEDDANRSLMALNDRLGPLLARDDNHDVYLSLDKVPCGRIVPKSEQPGHLWLCYFTYNDDGSWYWDASVFPIHYVKEDAFNDPPNIYDVAEVDTLGTVVVDLPDYVPVIATSQDHAVEQARPVVDDYVRIKTGKEPDYRGFA